jgi:hypothetical protein
MESQPTRVRNSTPLNFHNDDFNLLLKTSVLLAGGRKKTGVRPLYETWPMVAQAIGRRLLTRFQPPPKVVSLSNLQVPGPKNTGRGTRATGHAY